MLNKLLKTSLILVLAITLTACTGSKSKPKDSVLMLEMTEKV